MRKQATNRNVAINVPDTNQLETQTNLTQPAVLSKPFATASPIMTPSIHVAAVRSAASFDFQHLLQQEDSRVTDPKRGKVYGWKVKSKAWLTKPFRKVNKKLQHASSMASISRSLTDIKILSAASSLRSSMSDLQNKPNKKVETRRGSGMTRLLVKSIMVTPMVEPLHSITEHADSPVLSRKHSVHLRIDSCPNIVELPLENFSEKGESSMNVSTTSISTGCASSIESDSEENDEDEGTSTTFPSEPETVTILLSYLKLYLTDYFL